MSEPAKILRIAVGDRAVSAVHDRVAQARALVVCAHGAGGHMADRNMQRSAAVLCAQGLDVVRFNFLYRESGGRRPDPMPLLQKCFDAVVSHVRADLGSRALLLGGRSMGGRVASMMAAEQYPCDGLLLFAYPLHPPGQPERLRVAHLPKIQVPVLCFNGTRDPFCTRGLMERALAQLESVWTMHWLAGADHSLRLLKSSGRAQAEVDHEIGEATGRWLRTKFP